MLPTFDSDTLALDFDVAVTSQVYLFEQRETWKMMKAQARLTAEYAEILRLGGAIPDDEPPQSVGCAHEVVIDGECVECRQRFGPKQVTITVDGESRVVAAPPPGWCYDGEGKLLEIRPSEGVDFGDGFTTKPSPRIV